MIVLDGQYPANARAKTAGGLAAQIIADCSMWCTFQTGYVTLSGSKITEAANRKTANPTLKLVQTTDARRPDLAAAAWDDRDCAEFRSADSECMVQSGTFDHDSASTVTLVCNIVSISGTPYFVSKFTGSTDRYSINIDASPLTRILAARRASATCGALYATGRKMVVQLSHDGAGTVRICVNNGPVSELDAGGTSNGASGVAMVIGARLSNGTNPANINARHVLFHPVELLADVAQATKQAQLMECIRFVEGIETRVS